MGYLRLLHHVLKLCDANRRQRSHNGLLGLTLCLLLGGFLGNGIDRALYGAVTDFVYFTGGPRWMLSTFNLADVAITAGSVLLALTVIRLWIKKIRNDSAEDLEGTE